MTFSNFELSQLFNLMRVIKNVTAIEEATNARAIVIDVRERAEYQENHIPNSINLPLSEFSTAPYKLFPKQKFCLICNSQNRAKQVYQKLEEKGFSNVFLMQQGFEQLEEVNQPEKLVTGWTIDRQFRMTLGVLISIFLIGFSTVGNSFLVIPIILACGLVITSLIDRCYMRMGIALLPWNKGKRV